MSKETFEKIYEKPKEVVWTKTEPPKKLRELIENKTILPCKAIDIACGEGNYSLYLASKGFDVLGIDISENAIKLAEKNASGKDLNIRFKVMDIQELEKLDEKFDFVFELGLLHNLPRELLEGYIEKVSKILNKDGKYVSVHFNLESKKYLSKMFSKENGEGKDTLFSKMKLYFATQEEMKTLFEKYFQVIESKEINISEGDEEGSGLMANYFLLKNL